MVNVTIAVDAGVPRTGGGEPCNRYRKTIHGIVFPAQAGVSLAGLEIFNPLPRVPRTGGGEPPGNYGLSRLMPCSPHRRG